MKIVLAIDPGNIESGFTLIDEDYKILQFGKVANDEMLRTIEKYANEAKKTADIEFHVVIEMVACYGMAVGESVFETCVWIGMFVEKSMDHCVDVVSRIYRKEEKMNLCHSMKAKDSNITQALIDRFAPNTPNHGKGTKSDKGWFYGFKKDIWQAYAVGVTYLDKINKKCK